MPVNKLNMEYVKMHSLHQGLLQPLSHYPILLG